MARANDSQCEARAVVAKATGTVIAISETIATRFSFIDRLCYQGSLSRLQEEAFMPTGTVKFYNDQKGYGFIAPDGGGNDVFVHASALERAGLSGLREGQKVSFETEVDRRSGKTAVSTIRAV